MVGRIGMDQVRRQSADLITCVHVRYDIECGMRKGIPPTSVRQPLRTLSWSHSIVNSNRSGTYIHPAI